MIPSRSQGPQWDLGSGSNPQDLLPPLGISDGESDEDDLSGNDSDDDDLDDNDVLPPLAGDFDSDLEDLLCLHDAGTSVCWPPGLSEKELRRLQRSAGGRKDKTDDRPRP